jgi:hypothetical protein
LQQLAQTHLRDALRADANYLDTAIRLAAIQILDFVDAAFSKYAQVHITDLAALLRPWVSCWFGTNARFVEVCMVSHPLAPVYLSVALLLLNKRRMYADASSINLLRVMEIVNVETVITRGLQYMYVLWHCTFRVVVNA